MTSRLGAAVLIVVTAFYAYGALVHVLNMLSMTGFEWSSAPLKWQILDVFYLAMDVLVCAGLVRRYRPSIYAFYIAALTQIVLYTVLRAWITDVPEPFAVTPGQSSYLDLIVAFHAVSLALVSVALRCTVHPRGDCNRGRNRGPR